MNEDKAATKGINDMNDLGTVKERVAQNWVRRFKEGDTGLEEKPKSGRSSVMDDRAFVKFEQEPSTLSAYFGPSQSATNRFVHNLSLVRSHWNTRNTK